MLASQVGPVHARFSRGWVEVIPIWRRVGFRFGRVLDGRLLNVSFSKIVAFTPLGAGRL
jgi:hypothetical protein